MATKAFFARLQANPTALPVMTVTTGKRSQSAAGGQGFESDQQNALSRKINAMYFARQQNVPVDPRNGLDMRTMRPAQDPTYQHPREWNTFESNMHSRKPYYEGTVHDKLRHGFGRGTFKNKFFTYEGEWLGGKLHGNGKLLLGDGSFYEGEFRNNEITGTGFRQWPNGSHYTGEFLDGELSGQGVHVLAKGDRYEGGHQRNQRWGFGVLVMADGTRLQGQFEEHRLNGHGRRDGADGDVYVGDWCNGNMDGQGELITRAGDRYVGRFMRGMKNGPGRLLHVSSGILYECDWINDRPAIVPTRLIAELSERIAWVKPERPPLEPEEEDTYEEPEPPASLIQVLSESPIAAGETLPAFTVYIADAESKIQDGENGRLLQVSFGIFEQEEPDPAAAGPDEPAEPAEEPARPYKALPSTAYPIIVDKVWYEDPAAAAAAAASGEAGEVAAEPSGESADPAAAAGWRLAYPPGYVVGGVRLRRGAARVTLQVPAETPAGSYCVKLETSFPGPAWAGEPVPPVYIPLTVG